MKNQSSPLPVAADDGGQRDEWFKALTTITKLEHQLAAAQDALKKILSEIPSKPKLPIVVVIQEIAIAALAADREKAEQERLRIWREAPDQPDIQEAVIAKLDLVHRHAIEKAIADEREKVENLHKILGQKRTTIKELREQLVERGNTKQLMDALKDIRVGAPDIVQQQIKDALAKAGK